MRLHYLCHVDFERLGVIDTYAHERGYAVSNTDLFAEEALPAVRDIDALFVMGGPMNIYEHYRHPWLGREKAFISKAIAAGKKVIGICLGAQLIADVLGATVTRNAHREIGFFPVTVTACGMTTVFGALPALFTAFHWHGDTFSLPTGAVHCASSEACEHQAFTYGDNVLAMQFHLEYAYENIVAMNAHCDEEIAAGGDHVQKPSEILDRKKIIEANSDLRILLDRFLPKEM
ncbi:MAG: amidotransferase [Spirochaetota bacterium]